MGPKGKNNINWKGGVAEYPDHYEMKKLRLEVLEEANYTCGICGGKATEIHHIDKTKTNHVKENFLAVCRRCHIVQFHRDVVGRKRGGKNKPKLAIPVYKPEPVGAL